MTLKKAGPHPLGLEVVQIHAQGGRTSRAQGMARGLAFDLWVVAAATAHHPADGPANQHGGSGAEQGEARHGEPDAAGTATGKEPGAEGPQQGAVGAGCQAFGAAGGHHPVFANAPVQQQAPGGDALQAELGVEFPAGMEGRSVAKGREGNACPRQQGPENLGSTVAGRLCEAAAHGQHEIRAAVAAASADPGQLGGSQADRWIRRTQAQVQAGLVREARIGGHHHIGMGVGLFQAGVLDQIAEFRGGAHRELAPLLALA